jgi:ribonuclease P protein component
MANHRFPKALRLLLPREFERVYAQRQTARDAWIVMNGADNDLDHPRFGLAVSRRAGGAAARNRWKRLLREAFRLTQHRLPAIDIVCAPRASQSPSLQQLLESLPVLASRIERQLETRQRAEKPLSEAPTRRTERQIHDDVNSLESQ